MDGNGRWAQARSHSRIWGHIRGVKVVSDIVEDPTGKMSVVANWGFKEVA